MSDKSKEKPKIIVDDDWKAEAQAEKERLEAESHKKAEEKAGEEIAGAAPADTPPLDFMGLLNTLGMQAMMGMGGMEDPETKKRMLNLGLSKFNIDALAVIKEKTEGNLTEEEKTMLDKMLYELQMSFVSVSKQVAEMIKQQKAQAAAGGAGEKTAEAGKAGDSGKPVDAGKTPEKPADEKPKIEKG